MEWILDKTHVKELPRARYKYCYFEIDASGYTVRDVDLHSDYPSICFPIDYTEQRIIRSAEMSMQPVWIRKDGLERPAWPIRVTRLGVASMKFVESPRPVAGGGAQEQQ